MVGVPCSLRPSTFLTRGEISSQMVLVTWLMHLVHPMGIWWPRPSGNWFHPLSEMWMVWASREHQPLYLNEAKWLCSGWPKMKTEPLLVTHRRAMICINLGPFRAFFLISISAQWWFLCVERGFPCTLLSLPRWIDLFVCFWLCYLSRRIPSEAKNILPEAFISLAVIKAS